ncbi:MAG: hypothetical protein R2797_01900 [Gelidibacter sp.]
MKKKRLPFTIGEQYELHEFELNGTETIKIGKYEYEVYRCTTKLFDSLKLEGLMDVKLYYNADILARIDYIFHDNIEKYMTYFIPSKNENIINFNYLECGIEVIVTHSKYSR